MKSSIDRNYEKMRTIIERCRQEVGMVGRKSRTGEKAFVLPHSLKTDFAVKFSGIVMAMTSIWYMEISARLIIRYGCR